MISHRISAARISNKIIVLDGGKIVESGRHEELVSAGGLYSSSTTSRKKIHGKRGGVNEKITETFVSLSKNIWFGIKTSFIASKSIFC